MTRQTVLLVTALVAAGLIAQFAEARPRSKVPSPMKIAAHIAVLVRNPENVQIIRFADRPLSVRVVRGKALASGGSEPRASNERVAHGSRQYTPIPAIRGGAVVAAVSVVIPSASTNRGVAQIVSFANPHAAPVTVLRGPVVARVDLALPSPVASPDFGLFSGAPTADLDRVAFAVDGAESSHGTDPRMWRVELEGPQGPMQVSAAAAIDSGGGDRFDLMQNRQLGRAYLARMFQRYGNWPDAVAAYNWGPGNMDSWVAEGRPAAALPLAVERYRERVLLDGSIR